MEDDILIDDYLKGLLSKSEEKSFLKRLESDIVFNEKFKLEEQLFHALDEDSWSFATKNAYDLMEYKGLLESDDIKNLKKTLVTTNSKFNLKSNSKTKRLFYYLAAASIVVFLGFQLFFNQKVTNQDLYNNYVNLSELPSFVSRDNTTSELFEAQKLFEEKKYKEALEIFKSQTNGIDYNGNILIYIGISQTELDKYQGAEETFNQLIKSDLLDAQKGYWYKALLYLKQDRVEESKQILDKIISKNLYNKEKAQDLLKELE